jgi:hypothetical protein
LDGFHPTVNTKKKLVLLLVIYGNTSHAKGEGAAFSFADGDDIIIKTTAATNSIQEEPCSS